MPGRFRTVLCAAGLVVGLALVARPQVIAGQTFRAAVDLIAVDVQVFGRDGRPVESLTPSDFQVSLDGRPRRVVSAVFSRHEIRPPTAPTPLSSGVFELGDGMVSKAGSAEFPTPPRTIIIAVDTGSFRSLDIQPALVAAQRFTRQLAPDDLVGVFTLPTGPRQAPSINHASARQMLSTIVGRKAVVPGVFELSVEQIIDISTAMNSQSALQARATVTRMLNQVGANEPLDCEGNTALCVETALNETEGIANALEEEVLQGIAGLEELLRQLQRSPGRKTVLLLSSGMPVSDRPAGRPNIGNEVKRLGEQATYANATIHTLFFDPAVNSSFSSEARRAREMSGRTRAIYTRALVEFAEPSGGSMFEVTSSAGEAEIDRLVSRMSTYYVLGVEPEARDRDGRPHRLTVKVNRRDSSVKSRQLVIVPKMN